MPHRAFHRLTRLTVLALFITVTFAMVVGQYDLGVVRAETPPEDTSTTSGADTGASGGGAEATGGGTSATSDAGSTGSPADAGGGSGTTDTSGSSTAGNTGGADTTTTSSGTVGDTPPSVTDPAPSTSTPSTGSDAPSDTPTVPATAPASGESPPPDGVSSTNGTQSGTPPSSDATSTPNTSSSSTAAGEGTATQPVSSPAAGATASSGAATAIGNMSSTEIVQMVLAIVNIVLPGVDPATLVGPLVTINQNASVTNIGTANALSGNSSAVVSILSAAAGQAGLTTGQLASMVSAQASSTSGGASAVGNIAWTDIMQFASVIMSVNGDTSLTSALTSIMQNAQVSNQGAATATTGSSAASVTVRPNSSSTPDPVPADNLLLDSPPNDEDDGTNSDHKVLLWGPAAASDTLVWIYLDGKMCKAADISKDPDFPGSYIWEATIAPRECGAYRGARINFVVVNPSAQTLTWDNLVRESPEIRLSAGGSQVGTALQAGR